MKNTTLLALVIGIIVIVAGFLFFNSGANAQASTGQQGLQGEVQQVTVGMKDLSYSPETIKVRANQPVEITLDSSVRGCGRSLAIMGLGINKFSANPSEKITFTPNKKGTFTMTCSMGMVGAAQFIVE